MKGMRDSGLHKSDIYVVIAVGDGVVILDRPLETCSKNYDCMTPYDYSLDLTFADERDRILVVRLIHKDEWTWINPPGRVLKEQIPVGSIVHVGLPNRVYKAFSSGELDGFIAEAMRKHGIADYVKFTPDKRYLVTDEGQWTT